MHATRVLCWLASLAVFNPLASAQRHAGGVLHPRNTLASLDDTQVTTFQQLIDHSNSSEGTFSQRYYYNTQYWGGPGSPIVFDAPYEAVRDGIGYSITVEIARAVRGAIVAPEMRYYGESLPFKHQSTYGLRFMTIDNILSDLEYMAANVVFPFDVNKTSTPTKAPWIISGCSLSGGISGWMQATRPNLFWAYFADSAVIQAQPDFWQYFVPIKQHLGPQCASSVEQVINYFDGIGKSGNTTQIQALKDQFGLGGVRDLGAFAYDVFITLGDFQYGTLPGFCEAVNVSAPSITVEQATANFAQFYQQINSKTANQNSGKFVGRLGTGFRSQNLPGSGADPYFWLSCNELGWFFYGPPAGRPAVFSRLVTGAYFKHFCASMFPPEKGVSSGPVKAKGAALNAATGGWFPPNGNRIQWTNSAWDPYREVTVSSDFRPGGRLKSTPQAPVFFIPEQTHCAGYEMYNSAATNETIKNMLKWVSQFQPSE